MLGCVELKKLQVGAFGNSLVLTHPLRTKNFHSPSGQLASGNKILTHPRDNKAAGRRRKLIKKVFAIPKFPVLWSSRGK